VQIGKRIVHLKLLLKKAVQTIIRILMHAPLFAFAIVVIHKFLLLMIPLAGLILLLSKKMLKTKSLNTNQFWLPISSEVFGNLLK